MDCSHICITTYKKQPLHLQEVLVCAYGRGTCLHSPWGWEDVFVLKTVSPRDPNSQDHGAPLHQAGVSETLEVSEVQSTQQGRETLLWKQAGWILRWTCHLSLSGDPDSLSSHPGYSAHLLQAATPPDT